MKEKNVIKKSKNFYGVFIYTWKSALDSEPNIVRNQVDFILILTGDLQQYNKQKLLSWTITIIYYYREWLQK